MINKPRKRKKSSLPEIRLASVIRCSDCPNALAELPGSGSRCGLTGRIMSAQQTYNEGFPKWCPLPKPENIITIVKC